MNERITLTLGKICNGAFTPALSKLCGLTILSGRDAYALMRTLDLLEPELTAYQKALSGLLKKHGARSSLQELREAARLIEANGDAGEKQTLEDLRRKIQKLEPFERLEIGPGDPGLEAFQAERRELDVRPVELFLSRKISVPLDQLPSGGGGQSLNAFDMRELTPLADFVEVK